MLVPPVVMDEAEGAALLVRLELLFVCCARVGVLDRKRAAISSELLPSDWIPLQRLKASMELECLLEVVFKCG